MSGKKDRIDALRADYDKLVDVLKVRDAQIEILEKGRAATNGFIMQQISPTLNGLSAFLGECVKQIPSMQKVNATLIARAKREAKQQAKHAAKEKTV